MIAAITRWWKAVVAAVAVVLAGLLYAKGRKDGKAKVESDVLNERVRNDEVRNEAEARADRAADAVRVDSARDPERLREDDGFRRD